MITSRLDPFGKLMYGTGLANSIAFMMSGFRGWELFGMVKDDYGIGVQVQPQGATTNAIDMCAVYGKRHSIALESDDPAEQEQIDAGRTAIVLFKGIDNSSYMRRMEPAEYDRDVIRGFVKRKDDLFYNS